MEIRCAGREDSAGTAAAWEKNVPARSISQGVLVPIGGGKDSVVTLDLRCPGPAARIRIHPQSQGSHGEHRPGAAVWVRAGS